MYLCLRITFAASTPPRRLCFSITDGEVERTQLSSRALARALPVPRAHCIRRELVGEAIWINWLYAPPCLSQSAVLGVLIPIASVRERTRYIHINDANQLPASDGVSELYFHWTRRVLNSFLFFDSCRERASWCRLLC